MPYLSTHAVERALRCLDRLAASEHVVVEVAFCRGAVITVPYTQRGPGPLSDGAVQAGGVADALIEQVGKERRLPRDWMKEDVKYYLAFFAARGRTDYDVIGPNVLLSVAKPGHVLAMKLQACETTRPPHATDLADVAFLIEKMELNSWDAVASVHARFAPGCVLGDDVRMRVVEMIGTAK
jgi:hypothetical protein